MQIDMRVLELLASKLCHDLISPVSAINNGVELIEDIGGSVVDEAMKLIGDSAVQSARRLKLFRVAYGRAGNEDGLAFRDAKLIADQYLQGGKVKLGWGNDMELAAASEPQGMLKVLLNLLVMSEEMLAYGGDVFVRAQAEGEQKGLSVEVSGRNVQITPQIDVALRGEVAVEELTPRTIQAYVTGRFAQYFGFRLRYEQSLPDSVILSLEKVEIPAQVPVLASVSLS